MKIARRSMFSCRPTTKSSDILALTLSSAKAMHYPKDKLNIVLLDDGGTGSEAQLSQSRGSPKPPQACRRAQGLCADSALPNVTRAENVHAKAGNLNNGLMRTDGELVVVFDADHAPDVTSCRKPRVLSENEKLFLVQTPHFFSNRTRSA